VPADRHVDDVLDRKESPDPLAVVLIRWDGGSGCLASLGRDRFAVAL
jgi:hypothetical protein